MKYCIGRSAHGDIEGHGIHECLFCSDGTRQNALVIIHIVCKCISYDEFRTLHKEILTLLMCGEDCSISSRGHTEGLTQAVHGIGCKHTRAASATRTCSSFEGIKFVFCRCRIGTLHHDVNKIIVFVCHLACFHRAS